MPPADPNPAPPNSPARVDPPVTVSQLREVGLFGALSDEVLEHLAKTLRPVRFGIGDTIFREGDAAHEMFVVLDGEVEVVKRSRKGRDHRVALLGPTDCFGEMSIVEVQPRSATVRTVAPSRLLRIASEDFDRLYRHDLKAYALVVLNIARDLSRRLRVADGILAEFTAKVLDDYVAPKR
jgi:CRP/FNR family cyclic AMP-dependent transcriptional regulator